MLAEAQRTAQQQRQDALAARMELERLSAMRPAMGWLEPVSDPVAVVAGPVADQRPWLLVLVAAVALAAGRLAAWLVRGNQGLVATPADVAWPGRTRVLAVLGALDSPRARAEAGTALRTALLAERPESGGWVVQLTATGFMEGQASLTVMLAIHLAQAGHRVLLVDTDLAAGRVAQRLGVPAGPGLAGVLTGQCNEPRAILSVDPAGLSVLPAGQLAPPQAPADLLASPAMGEALRRWRKRWDIVLLDSPPVLETAEASILSHQADETLLIVCRHRSRRDDIQAALERLRPPAEASLPIVFFTADGAEEPKGPEKPAPGKAKKRPKERKKPKPQRGKRPRKKGRR